MNRVQKRQLALLAVLSATLTTFVMAQSVSVRGSIKAIIKPTPTPDPKVVHDPRPCHRPIDLVICLDTSGSMTGLINSARAKLWDVVNELVKLEPNARLRVGLLTYGSPQNSTAASGWVRRQSGLTSDLDTVYARMMEITTNGGAEYVGWVLNDALHTMSWSQHPRALKIVFVAGNESADQAAHLFNFRQVARAAREQGITINSIYAGAHSNGVSEHWDQVAMHGGGEFFAIDQDAATVQISTPQDKLLIELNATLNATYVPFGQAGAKHRANQLAQDANAAGMGAQTEASRVQAKASIAYRNAEWDLVDADAEPGFALEKVVKADLPAAMRNMSFKEQKTYVAGQRAARATIQRKIQQVSDEREGYLKRERAKRGSKKTGLDDAMKKALRKQVQE